MKRHRLACFLIFCWGVLIFPQSDYAAVYRWRDAQGKTHYSSALPATKVYDLEIKQGNSWIRYSGEKPPPSRSTPQVRAVLDYTTYQSVIVIPVTLNEALETQFAVDTGASYTIISPAVAQALQLRPNPEIPPLTLHTANGPVQAPLVNVKTLTMGPLTTYNVTAAIHDFQEGSHLDGLLGLNVLRRFTVTVDSTRQQITFDAIATASDFTAHDCVQAREWVLEGQALNDGSSEEISAYQRAIKLCPDLLEAYYHLGTVYYKQHDYQRAIDTHHRILQRQPGAPEAHYRLGVLYMLERQFVLAKGEFQKTLELDPAHSQAQEYLNQLRNY